MDENDILRNFKIFKAPMDNVSESKRVNIAFRQNNAYALLFLTYKSKLPSIFPSDVHQEDSTLTNQ